MHKFNDLNQWEEDYYKQKQRKKEAALLFKIIWLTAIGIILALALSSCKTSYTAAVLGDSNPIPPMEPVVVACDTLIDRETGEKIPVYNCNDWTP